MLKIKR